MKSIITSIALVEDDDPLRRSLEVLLQGSPGFRCIASCRDAESAIRAFEQQTPDVVVCDLRLPKMSGIELIARLKRQYPSILILVLTVSTDGDAVFQALRAGASGYLTKGGPLSEILEGIEEIKRGGAPMSSSIARQVVSFFNRQGPTSPAQQENLSPREQEILQHLMRGERTHEIAAHLQISPFTLRAHIRNIYEKLHVHSRAELMARYN